MYLPLNSIYIAQDLSQQCLIFINGELTRSWKIWNFKGSDSPKRTIRFGEKEKFVFLNLDSKEIYALPPEQSESISNAFKIELEDDFVIADYTISQESIAIVASLEGIILVSSFNDSLNVFEKRHRLYVPGICFKNNEISSIALSSNNNNLVISSSLANFYDKRRYMYWLSFDNEQCTVTLRSKINLESDVEKSYLYSLAFLRGNNHQVFAVEGAGEFSLLELSLLESGTDFKVMLNNKPRKNFMKAASNGFARNYNELWLVDLYGNIKRISKA